MKKSMLRFIQIKGNLYLIYRPLHAYDLFIVFFMNY